MNTDPEMYFGALNLLTFGFSVIAAVLAIDMYALLRTGEFGRTWRILIVASVIFVLSQVLDMSGHLLGSANAFKIGQVVQLIFIIAVAYAFYRQRQVYTRKLQRMQSFPEEDDDDPYGNMDNDQ